MTGATSTTSDECHGEPLESGSFGISNSREGSPRFEREQHSSLTFRELLTQFVCTKDAHLSAPATMKPRTRNPVSSTQSETLRLPVTKQSSPKQNDQYIENQNQNDSPKNGNVDLSQHVYSKRKATVAPASNRPSKKQRSSTTESPKRAMVPAGSKDNKLVDSLCTGLLLVMVGVNPSIETGKTGHAYSHPTNKFWKLLHESNITPIRHKPQDTHSLMDLYGIGHTNMVSAASVAEKDIPRAVYQAGVAVLDDKIRTLRPQAVALVGKNVWENWFQYKTGRRFNAKKDAFAYGWQEEEMQVGRTRTRTQMVVNGDENKDKDTVGLGEFEVEWAGAKTYVLPTSSAACAFWNKDGIDTRIEFWKPLGEWFAPKRVEWVEARESKILEQKADMPWLVDASQW